MYAIIQYSGKQYRVQAGDIVEFDRVDAEPGKTITIESVLLVGDGENIRIGAPYVEGAKVTFEVKEHFRGPKLIVFKMKRRKRNRKKNGHRQEMTRCEIKEIA